MWSVLAVLSLAVVVLGAVGVVSCLVGQQRPAGMGGEPPHSTLPMLALHSGMERLRLEAGAGVGAGRPERQSSHTRRAVDCAVDRAVRLAAVSTDLQLDLPPNIALPDGEEYPYGASARLHIRDPDQESEIYQKCIRPPPNRTVFDGESPPPYRSSSASGSFAGGGSSGSAILRCPVAVHPGAHPGAHPGSALVSAAPAGPGLPAVIVPSPPRKQDAAVSPALFLAGPATSGKHSTGPPSGGVGSGSTAAGLARLLSPSLTPAPTPDRVLKVRPTAAGAKTSAQGQASVPVLVCRTAHSAPSGRSGRPSAAGVDLVNVTSAPCSPAVRVIPATVRGASHLAGLTMVPCLTESRTEAASSATAEPSPSPCAPAPARTRERPEEEPLATPLPRPARPARPPV